MGVGFKHGMVALIGASAMFLASPATAKTYNLGTIVAGFPYGTGGPIANPLNAGDSIFFSLSQTFDVGVSANSAPQTKVGKFIVKLTSLTAKFYQVGVPDLFIGQLADGDSKTYSGLLTGAYRIDVTGTSSNGKGGSYSLNLIGQPAAAPGPAGILFVGGAAALMASRRRRQKAKLALG